MARRRKPPRDDVQRQIAQFGRDCADSFFRIIGAARDRAERDATQAIGDFDPAVIGRGGYDTQVAPIRRSRDRKKADVAAGAETPKANAVRDGADLAVCAAARRVLARKHHPDQGGSAEKMSQINAAYAAIAKLYVRTEGSNTSA